MRLRDCAQHSGDGDLWPGAHRPNQQQVRCEVCGLWFRVPIMFAAIDALKGVSE